MPVTPTNNIYLGHTSTQTSVSQQTSSVNSGLSSIGSSISSVSAESSSFFGGIFAIFFHPFVSGFDAIKAFFASLFGSNQKKVNIDQERYGFINGHLNEINAGSRSHQECLDKFFHVKDPILKLEAFKLIQSSTQVTNQTIKTFFGHLPVDVQDHIKRHIWEANGRHDNGMGVSYGNYMIYWYPKHSHVATAIDKCLAEAKDVN